jgi:hypothetical protein
MPRRENRHSQVNLTLTVLPGRLAVCRLPPASDLPIWATIGPLFVVARTADELSILCPEHQVPAEVVREEGWRAIKFEGPFNFGLTGILASVVGPLAEAGISVFAFSTYETDYVLVREPQLEPAIKVLSDRGHLVRPPR